MPSASSLKKVAKEMISTEVGRERFTFAKYWKLVPANKVRILSHKLPMDLLVCQVKRPVFVDVK